MTTRPLTSGEVALARSVFGEAIEYGRVRLVRRKWWPFQPRRFTMAPMGNIHFHPQGEAWSDDFSAEPLGRQAFFIHEMTHVWQAQKGGRFYLPLMRHAFSRYAYVLKAGKAVRPLRDRTASRNRRPPLPRRPWRRDGLDSAARAAAVQTGVN